MNAALRHVLLVCATAGCTQKVSNRVARHDIESDQTIAVVPSTGVYKVKYVTAGSNHNIAVAGSARILAKGNRIGFQRTPEGATIALAAFDEFEIRGLPADVTRLHWYQKSDERTEFGEFVDASLQSLPEITARAAGEVAGAMIASGIKSALESDDDCDKAQHKKHKKH